MEFQTQRLKGYLSANTHLHKDGEVTCSDGFSFNLLDFKEEYVKVDFIFESLSKISRYVGHTAGWRPYSVAQHSYIMAEAILLTTGDPRLAWDALFHDSSEAYMNDMMKPLKNIMPEFEKLEKHIEAIIFKVIGVKYPFDPIIKKVDVNICEYEISFLMANGDLKFDIWDCEKSYLNCKKMMERLMYLININESGELNNG